MNDPALVFTDNGVVVVNFGMYGGRTATQAEIERLGDALLGQLESVEVLCVERYEFDRERRGSVYQVRVVAPGGENAVDVIELWARECLDERRLITP